MSHKSKKIHGKLGGHVEPIATDAIFPRSLLKRLKTKKQLAIIPGATHLFEELGALEQVARLAADWFRRSLQKLKQ